MSDPAAVLTAAADHLRAWPVTTYDLALADLLEHEAQYPKRLADPDDDASRLLLATARKVLGANR